MIGHFLTFYLNDEYPLMIFAEVIKKRPTKQGQKDTGQAGRCVY